MCGKTIPHLEKRQGASKRLGLRGRWRLQTPVNQTPRKQKDPGGVPIKYAAGQDWMAIVGQALGFSSLEYMRGNISSSAAWNEEAEQADKSGAHKESRFCLCVR